MYSMNVIVGTADFLFITFDTLRYDIAVQEMENGGTPFLKTLIPAGWEKRHSPGSFTYASHAAFFAGFLPTPAEPGRHERLFALSFAGSETTGSSTCCFETDSIISGFAERGYKTVCIGGVGFFKKENPLSCVLPSLFQHSYWKKEFGVTDPKSAENQTAFAVDILNQSSDKTFLYINLSALHQPNCFYIEGAESDSIETHAAALRYIDRSLPPLFECIRNRDRDTFVILTSDHGTAYGDDGYWGHRLAHECVWTVPFASFLIKGKNSSEK